MPSTRSNAARTILFVLCLVLASSTVNIAIADQMARRPSDSAASQPSVCTSSATTPAAKEDSKNVSTTLFIAPGAAYDGFTNASGIARGIETGALTPADIGVNRTWEDEVVAYNDTMVHRIRLNGSATGLLDRFAGSNRSTPTAAFGTLVESGDLAFRYIGGSACPPTLALNASIDRGAVHIVPDRSNDSLYLVLDTDRLLFDPPGEGGPTTDTFVRGHNGFSLTIAAESGLADEDSTVGSDYQVETARARFTGRNDRLLRVEGTANQPIHGRTNLAPGTEVTVSVRPQFTPGDAINRTVTVDRSRGFTARFDLSSAPDEEIYTASIRGPDDRLLTVKPVTLVAVGNTTGANVSVANQTSVGTRLFGVSLTTTDGGFLVVRNESGGIIGVSDYLDPGAASPQVRFSPPLTRNRTVTVTPYRDVNGNRAFDGADVAYRVNGATVRDSATLEVHAAEQPRTTEATTMQMQDSWTTTTEAQSEATAVGKEIDPTESQPPGSPGMPGFSIGATALALAVAGLLSILRRNV